MEAPNEQAARKAHKKRTPQKIVRVTQIKEIPCGCVYLDSTGKFVPAKAAQNPSDKR